MHQVELARLAHDGDTLSDELRTTLKYPSLTTGLAGFARLRDGVGIVRKARILFGVPVNDRFSSVLSKDFTIIKSGSTGYAAVPLLTFPIGVVKVIGCSFKLTATIGGSFALTTPQFAAGLGAGNAGAATSNTLTTGSANILAASAPTSTSGRVYTVAAADALTSFVNVDGTTTPAQFFLNFGLASDPGASGNTITFAKDSYVDLKYIFQV